MAPTIDTTDQDDELYEHYAFKVEKGQPPLRIDKYLMNFVENATRNKIQQAAKDGCIFVLYSRKYFVQYTSHELKD